MLIKCGLGFCKMAPLLISRPNDKCKSKCNLRNATLPLLTTHITFANGHICTYICCTTHFYICCGVREAIYIKCITSGFHCSLWFWNILPVTSERIIANVVLCHFLDALAFLEEPLVTDWLTDKLKTNYLSGFFGLTVISTPADPQ